ncbi:MAG: hypothetical protein WCA20_29145 [Candidatus Sulfotelmatobacter sp.]
MNVTVPERRPATEEISGVIGRVTFHNDNGGFCPADESRWQRVTEKHRVVANQILYRGLPVPVL